MQACAVSPDVSSFFTLSMWAGHRLFPHPQGRFAGVSNVFLRFSWPGPGKSTREGSLAQKIPRTHVTFQPAVDGRTDLLKHLHGLEHDAIS
jgi:hypothetical protein